MEETAWNGEECAIRSFVIFEVLLANYLYQIYALVMCGVCSTLSKEHYKSSDRKA
jgi:hypothetical protein